MSAKGINRGSDQAVTVTPHQARTKHLTGGPPRAVTPLPGSVPLSRGRS